MSAIYRREVRSYLCCMTGAIFMAFILCMTGIYMTVYNLMDDWIPSIYGFADKVRAGLFEGLEIDFTEIKKFVGGE